MFDFSDVSHLMYAKYFLFNTLILQNNWIIRVNKFLFEWILIYY